MSNDVIKLWLAGGQWNPISGILLRPIAHPCVKGVPLSISRGQAEAFFLESDQGARYILKKFHPGLNLNRPYLQAVGLLVPQHAGFSAAAHRKLLNKSDVGQCKGYASQAGLADWMDGALLMPRIDGVDWACLADDLRAGDLVLQRDQRLTLAHRLTELVAILESHGCAHRDLSSANVFVDVSSLAVRLIDFDSFYHHSLPRPAETTCGTAGYAAPWLWKCDRMDAPASWMEGADRFALAILIAELLVLDNGSPLAEEGGMFRQDNLRIRRGDTFDHVRSKVAGAFPDIAAMLDRALFANRFEECPAAAEWQILLDHLLGHRIVPSLTDVQTPDFVRFVKSLTRRQPACPLWPVPRLEDIPAPALKKPSVVPYRVVPLPANPWKAPLLRVIP